MRIAVQLFGHGLQGSRAGLGPRALREAAERGCLLAHSLNGLFFRNCVNFAFPAMECREVYDAFGEGDIAEVDFDAVTVRNVTTGRTLSAIGLPPRLLDLLKAGGIYPLLEREGYLAPRAQPGA